MNRAAKAESLLQLKDIFADAGVVVVARYSGLSVAELSDLRGQLKAEQAQVRVVKNRLAKMALDGRGGNQASDMFVGPVALAWSADPVTAPKIAVKFAKDQEKFGLVGGLMGEDVLDEAQIKALAALPSRDELRGKLIGLIQAPATKIAGVLQAPAGQLARLLSAHAQNMERQDV